MNRIIYTTIRLFQAQTGFDLDLATTCRQALIPDGTQLLIPQGAVRQMQDPVPRVTIKIDLALDIRPDGKARSIYLLIPRRVDTQCTSQKKKKKKGLKL
jgi:hypothetical protein